jgi:quinol monooxygenase YgiN
MPKSGHIALDTGRAGVRLMGRFIQVIDFSTSNIDEIDKMGEEMRQRRESDGGGGPLRVIVAEDRDRPGHFLNIVEFESYETAMANSEHPETQAFAQRMSELVDGPPAFYNLEVRHDWAM